jgi:hypothetical protein
MGISAVLQSLTRSGANLRSSGLALELGPNTALTAAISGTSGAVSLDQYSGTIKVAFATSSAMTLSVRTPGLVVSSSGGKLSIEVNGTTTEIAVEAGTVKAVDTETGRVLVLHDGQSIADLRAEIVVSSASPNGTQVAVAGSNDKSGANSSSESSGTFSVYAGGSTAAGRIGANTGGASTSDDVLDTSSNAGGNTTSHSDETTNSNAGGDDNSNAGRSRASTQAPIIPTPAGVRMLAERPP